MQTNTFRTITGKKLKYPIFFPDATMGVVRTLENVDLENVGVRGILVNSYHLYRLFDKQPPVGTGGIRNFMNWSGAVISDSGGFQIMSLARKNKDNVHVDSKGVVFKKGKRRVRFTPKKSIEYQLSLGTDLVVVLDDIGKPGDSRSRAAEGVERTIEWAKESKNVFERYCRKLKIKKKPYLIGVVQGGKYKDLRVKCTKALVDIGFDGLGYGGILEDKDETYNLAELIENNTPNDYLLYGLGIGKPEDVVKFVHLRYKIFDCVIPTREARHGALYVYSEDMVEDIDVTEKDFYKIFRSKKRSNLKLDEPVSKVCDCLLCKNYSKAYLTHLFKIGDSAAYRLSTIHNLRFYTMLMERLRD